MSNYVLKYRRGAEVKYISHLDFIRMFYRAVRRSDLPMTYSQGFNPHPVMTVAMPLSVGVTSECEFMKIGFEGEFSESEIISRLIAALPGGFAIVGAKRVEGKELDFAKLDRAEYIVEVELEKPNEPNLAAFLGQEKILVMKKSKSGVKEADIKPYVYRLEILEQQDLFLTFRMEVAAGNLYNLKPETVLDAMHNFDPDFIPVFSSVHRKRILAGAIEYL